MSSTILAIALLLVVLTGLIILNRRMASVQKKYVAIGLISFAIILAGSVIVVDWTSYTIFSFLVIAVLGFIILILSMYFYRKEKTRQTQNQMLETLEFAPTNQKGSDLSTHELASKPLEEANHLEDLSPNNPQEMENSDFNFGDYPNEETEEMRNTTDVAAGDHSLEDASLLTQENTANDSDSMEQLEANDRNISEEIYTDHNTDLLTSKETQQEQEDIAFPAESSQEEEVDYFDFLTLSPKAEDTSLQEESKAKAIENEISQLERNKEIEENRHDNEDMLEEVRTLERQLEAFEDADPSDEDAMDMENDSLVQTESEREPMQKLTKDQAGQMYVDAIELEEQGKIDQAIALSKQVVLSDTKKDIMMMHFLHLKEMYERQGQADEVKELAKEVLALNEGKHSVTLDWIQGMLEE